MKTMKISSKMMNGYNMIKIQCPYCNRIIDSLYFNTACTEYGSYIFPTPQDIKSKQEFRTGNGDWDYGDNEGSGEYCYTCPECDAEIDNPRDCIVEIKEKKTKKQLKEEKAKEYDEQTPIVEGIDKKYIHTPYIPDTEPWITCPLCTTTILLTDEEYKKEEYIICTQCKKQITLHKS